jgi:hypothetical protein
MSGAELARTAHIGKSAASKWRGILAVEHIRAEEAAQQDAGQFNQAAQ